MSATILRRRRRPRLANATATPTTGLLLALPAISLTVPNSSLMTVFCWVLTASSFRSLLSALRLNGLPFFLRVVDCDVSCCYSCACQCVGDCECLGRACVYWDDADIIVHAEGQCDRESCAGVERDAVLQYRLVCVYSEHVGYSCDGYF